MTTGQTTSTGRAASQELYRYFRVLRAHFGPPKWWPARTRLEVILGAILTQNTNWRNAALAIRQLRAAGLLRQSRLRLLSHADLWPYIRPAGFYRQKARTIRNFFKWLERDCQGSLKRLFALPPEEARTRLLSINGLGPETVDAILLYAGRFPFFVADAYSRRVLGRHGLISAHADYRSAQEHLHKHLKRDYLLYNEYHALLVETGKHYCVKNAPKCVQCPLERFLPENGAIASRARSGAPSKNRMSIRESGRTKRT